VCPTICKIKVVFLGHTILFRFSDPGLKPGAIGAEGKTSFKQASLKNLTEKASSALDKFEFDEQHGIQVGGASLFQTTCRSEVFSM
jgi:hypothetical protein